jgi:parvulin-like peptidyl-prolyl isomerase
MIKNMMKFRGLFFSVSGFILVALSSCASLPSDSTNIAAYVDNDPITIGDIEYSLQVDHRRENLSKTTGINISEYLNKVIDERLLVHEALRMGMDQNPELNQKVDAYVLRESVSRLYSEEILDKVKVSQEEIIDHYKKEYTQYTLSSIETDTDEDAGMIREELKAGKDFGMLAREYANHEFRKVVEDVTYARKDLNKVIQDVIDSLEPGETSNVFEAGHRYYLLKLINVHDAPGDEMETEKEGIMQAIRQRKVEERSDEYLDYLNRKMEPEIQHDIVSLIPIDGNREERSQWLQDRRALVTLRKSALTVGELVKMLRPGTGNSKDMLIKQWIDRQAVDYEALDRKYDVHSDLKDKTRRYKNKKLIDMYTKNVLFPGVEISEDDLMDFYQNNQDDFSGPAKYKVQQITSNTESEAAAIRKELLNGADFSWMAKNRSVDNYASAGGTIGWWVKDQLSEDLHKVIGELEPGQISDVMVSGGFFRIYRVIEKTGKKLEKFEKVRPVVHKKVFEVKYKQLYDSHVEKLKKEAAIEINHDVVQDMDRMFNQG